MFRLDELFSNQPPCVVVADDSQVDAAPFRLRRRNSETMRAQYINTKELR
jgi:hypothetical protein